MSLHEDMNGAGHLSELLRDKSVHHKTMRTRLVSDDSFFGRHCNLGTSSLASIAAPFDIPDKSFDGRDMPMPRGVKSTFRLTPQPSKGYDYDESMEESKDPPLSHTYGPNRMKNFDKTNIN